MEEKLIPPKQLLQWAQILERMTYRVVIGEQPSFSVIKIYDELTNATLAEIYIRCWIEKDLDIIARHQIRLLRGFQAEVLRHEYFEKCKHQTGLYFDNGGFVRDTSKDP